MCYIYCNLQSQNLFCLFENSLSRSEWALVEPGERFKVDGAIAPTPTVNPRNR